MAEKLEKILNDLIKDFHIICPQKRLSHATAEIKSLFKSKLPKKELFAGKFELIEPLSENYDKIALICGRNQVLTEIEKIVEEL